MNRSKAFIIYSGNNQRAVIAFCRFASKNAIPFYIVAAGEDDSIFLSEYNSSVIYTRTSRLLSVKEFIDSISELKESKLIILPSSEYLNRFLLANRNKIENSRTIIPLVDAKLYKKISDKNSFSNLCAKYGLITPKKYKSVEEANIPLVIKPKKYFNQNGAVQFKPILIFDIEELKQNLAREDINDYFFQEYVDGESYYLLFYISKSGDHVVYSQKNLVQQKNGGSILVAKSAKIHFHQIAQDYLKMLQNEKFSGLIMIELRHKNDKYWMIEANPRLWGPSQLFVDAQIPIFHRFCEELGFNIDIPLNLDKPFKYLWFGGFPSKVEDLKNYFSDSDDCLQELNKWKKIDIYNRPDTQNIYKKEL